MPVRKIIAFASNDNEKNIDGNASERKRFRFSLFRPRRVDIVPLVFANPETQGLDAQTVKEWSLVLTARHLEHEIEDAADGYGIFVPSWLVKAAVREIRLYRHENAAKAREDTLLAMPKTVSNTQSVLGLWAAVTAFFIITGAPSHVLGYDIDWKSIGSGDTAAFLLGAWYRAVTPLFLHADVAHLFSNVATGAVFLTILCRHVGIGTGFFLSLATGVAGNVMKAILQGPGQHFIGASTAVFGMVGLLGGLFAMATPVRFSRKSLIPLGAALTLLAFLGSGGEESAGIDLAGHALGFAAGIILGLAEGMRQRRFGRTSFSMDMILGILALGITTAAWTAAVLG
ncbi:rhomboid family intramembrane serine protease [Desulfovibrio inopinatus]|uniref:rhomboid family intramembrane serine protease n=1 Tax=Desulfovibrio inopinatus TaxID=102109 RepID=UPI000428891C|nr:rhomboid family intramembrane serine protease [Desulfovibrio inopinatus]